MSRKIAFITGASAGIGQAAARIFASQQYNLVLAARRKEKLDELAGSLGREFGISVLPLRMDVTSREEVAAAIGSLAGDWRKISVLVNNAGLAKGLNPIDEGNIDDWEVMIDTNLKGLLYVTRAVLPLMKENKTGHVVNIGSISGKEIYANGNVYCATKHAVDALNKAMRLELSAYPIRVTAIHPGAVETEFSMVRFGGDEDRAAAVYKGFDNLVADDVADAIWYAVSRPAHVNINEMIVMPTAQPMAGVIHRK